jgi:hypothetical protein
MMMMMLLIEEDREKEEARHSKKIHFPGIILYYLRLQVIPPGTVTGILYIAIRQIRHQAAESSLDYQIRGIVVVLKIIIKQENWLFFNYKNK